MSGCRCPVVIHAARIPLVRSISSRLVFCRAPLTTTIRCWNFFCARSTSGKRGPSTAITSCMVTFVRSALISVGVGVSPAATRFSG